MNDYASFEELLRSTGAPFTGDANALGTVAVLLTETLRHRDRLRQEKGYVLTVEDTRVALDTVANHLSGSCKAGQPLTPEQAMLVHIYLQRLTSIV